MKQGFLSCAVAVVLVASTVTPIRNAQAAAVWGATEWTQIANNIELVLQYKEMVDQTITQVKQYEAQLKSLRQMDSRKLDSMLTGVGGVKSGEEVLRALNESAEVQESLNSLTGNMGALMREASNAMEVAEVLRSRGHNVNPQDYVGMMRALGELQQGSYAERLETIDRAAQDAVHDIERVNRIAATSKDIQTHVEGFGALVQTNAVMSSQLSGLRQTMSTVAAMNAESARVLSKQAADADAMELRRRAWTESAILPSGAPSR